jgi:uncharacterized protein YdaU (DUF1376 family)
LNYYPFHVGDYVSATRHLSWEEDAAFRRLLDTYYTTEKPIPADLKQACRLVIAQTESQREAVKTVLEEFFELTDEGWINRRADAEIEAMRVKQQKQRDKANKRWATVSSAKNENAAMPRHQETDAAASKDDAVAMPPTPTPTPTPRVETPQRRASRLPAGWMPDPVLIAWAKGERPDLDPLKATERFRDFWTAKPGKDGTKLDWDATWRNWIRAEKAPTGSRPNGRGDCGDVFAGAH